MTHLATVLAPLLEQAASGGAGAPAGPLGACGGGSSQMIIMMVLVFGIFYFLIIRPSQKREKERQSMLSALKPGDTVVTAGGLVGRITGTAERYVVIEISPKVRVRVLRAQVSGLDEAPSDDAGSGKKKQGSQGKGDRSKGRKSGDERADDDKKAKDKSS